MTRPATSAAILGIFVTGMMVGWSAGCSDDPVDSSRHEPDADAAAGTGGATSPGTDAAGGGSGGSPGIGGAPGTGGSMQLGGSTGSGGRTGAGGTMGVGGTTGTGGSTQLGGRTGAGGATGAGGSTGKVCGGFAGQQCASPTDICETAPGQCCCDFMGTCAVRPDVCAEDWQPVCGCDRKTYSNDCTRLLAGMSKDYDGECRTADAGVKDAAIQPDSPTDAGRDRPTAIMTPTLPAPCTTSADCCVAMDICMATAYLVGKAEFDAMVASIESVHVPYTSSCLACVHPAVQVQCQAGFCVGEQLSFYAEGTPFDNSHCGTMATSDAAPTSLASALSVTDGGTSPSKWGCGI